MVPLNAFMTVWATKASTEGLRDGEHQYCRLLLSIISSNSPGIKSINPFFNSHLYLPRCSQDVSGRPDHQNISIYKFFNKFISTAIVMQQQIFKKKIISRSRGSGYQWSLSE